ncbi:MAG: hypothetical protein AAFV29_12195 [Myxococcota bacterium]
MHTIGSKQLLLLLIVGSAATHCSGSDDSPDPMTNPDSGIVADSGVDCTDAFIASVGGSVQDQDGTVLETMVDGAGAPISGPGNQLCIEQADGPPLCLRPVQTAAGAFSIQIPSTDRCLTGAAMRVFPFDDQFTTTYCQIDFGSSPASDFAISMPLTMYEVEAPTTLPPEGDGTTARTVVFNGGIEVDVTPDRFFPGVGGYAGLQSRLIQSSDPVPCGAASQNFDGIVAFAPEGNIQDAGGGGQGFPVRIPAGDLAEGAMVDLFVQGGLDCNLEDGSLVKEAEWVQFGTGVVDANGMISGGRLPCFNWLAWRAQ